MPGRRPDISSMTAKPTMSRKPSPEGAKAPASFLYRGIRIRWPQKRTKRTDAIYAAARKVMNLDPAEPAAR
jgi:hypothetical protein